MQKSINIVYADVTILFVNYTFNPNDTFSHFVPLALHLSSQEKSVTYCSTNPGCQNFDLPK